MQILFVIFLALFGGTIACRFPRGGARNWMLIVTIWLSVPLGFIVETIVGFYLADLGGCTPSAAKEIECFVHGWDISAWMNGLVFSGYGFAFFAFPWFAIGGFCVLIYGFLYAF